MPMHEARYQLFRLQELLAETGTLLITSGVQPDDAVAIDAAAAELSRRIIAARAAAGTAAERAARRAA
jgi:hypothetical protein